jgi:transcriptional regulator with XRE-family HTH domain
MDDLGKRIKDKRKKERLSAEDLAIRLETKKENIYKWEMGAKPSDPEVFGRLNAWLNNIESNTKKLESPAGSYQDKYIQLLEEQVNFLKERVREALQDCGDKIDSMSVNLEGVAQNVVLGRADIRAFGEYQVMKDAQGDEKKRAKIMGEIGKLIALNLTSVNQKVGS